MSPTWLAGLILALANVAAAAPLACPPDAIIRDLPEGEKVRFQAVARTLAVRMDAGQLVGAGWCVTPAGIHFDTSVLDVLGDDPTAFYGWLIGVHAAWRGQPVQPDAVAGCALARVGEDHPKAAALALIGATPGQGAAYDRLRSVQAGYARCAESGAGLFCTRDTCANGRCRQTWAGARCDCAGTGYTGDRCAADIDECTDGHDCAPSAQCENLPGHYQCACGRGLVPDGAGCAGCASADGLFGDPEQGPLYEEIEIILNEVPDLAAGDFDGDGDDDLVYLVLRTAELVWRANEGGVFGPPQRLLDRVRYEHVALGDVDGDGRLDVVLGGQGLHWWRNEPGGLSERGPVMNCGTLGVTVHDFDGDGDGDIFGRCGHGVFVAQNRGPRFETLPVVEGFGGTTAWTFLDFDGDGDQDLMVGRPHDRILLVENRTTNFRVVSSVSHTAFRFTDFAVGDFDRDGDMDLFMMESDGRVVVAERQGEDWRFTITVERFINDATLTFADLVDLDRDGDLDLVGGNPARPVWLEAIDGGFAAPRTPERNAAAPTSRILMRDFDGDGDLDLAYAARNRRALLSFENRVSCPE